MHHPLDILLADEINTARDVILIQYPGKIVGFREIYLQEPPKAELKEFLALEHSGRLSPTSPRPARLARCLFDVFGSKNVPEIHEALVDVVLRKTVKDEKVGSKQHVNLIL
jgi:primary-amine oxidase